MKTETKAQVGIFSMALLSMAPMGIASSLALIVQAFPDYSVTEVQMLMAIPNLLSLFAAIAVGAVSNRIPRKLVAMAGPALVLLGGVLPFFFHQSLEFMMVCSAFLGFGTGCITNMTQVLLNDFVPAEGRQRSMLLNVVFVNIGGIAMTLIGGMLATIGWEVNYLIYLMALPALLLVAMLVPSTPVVAAEGAKSGEKAGLKSLNPLTIVIALVCGFFFMLVYNVFPNNVSLLIDANGIGDASTSGLVNSVGLVGGLVAGFVLSYIIGYFEKVSLAVAFAIVGASLMGLGFVANLAVYFVAGFGTGFAMSILMAQCPYLLSVTSTSATMPLAMSIYSVGSSLGSYLSPTVMNGVSGLLLGGDTASVFVVGGALAVIVAVVLLVTGFQAKVLKSAQK